jgi:hypothetical protein
LLPVEVTLIPALLVLPPVSPPPPPPPLLPPQAAATSMRLVSSDTGLQNRNLLLKCILLVRRIDFPQ